MLLRLYKGCRLSQSYDEVFYPRKINDVDVHAAYLTTLQSVDVELGEVYLTRDGMLSFEWDFWALGNIENYNYMRLSDENLTSYAFINSSTYINGLATVRYSMDVWATFAPGMTLGDSLMTATRFPRSDRPCELPLKPISNLTPLEIVTNSTGRVGIVVAYQYYSLTQQGQQSQRQINTAILADYNGDALIGNFDDVAQEAVYLTAISSTSTFQYKETPPSFITLPTYYEIKTCWILPEEWINLIWNSVSSDTPNTIKSGDPLPGVTLFQLFDIAGLNLLKSYNIPANQYLIGFGPHTNALPISYNGLSRSAGIVLSASRADFTIELELDGGRATITDAYEFDIPIAAASAAETQQAKIARQIRNQQSAAQLWQSAFSVAGSVGLMATGVGSLSAAPGLAAGQIAQGFGGIGGGISGLIRTIQDIATNNAALYSTNTGTRCTQSPALNSPRGLSMLILQPSNSHAMDAAISEQGYSVFYSTTALLPDAADDATLTQRGYDILKYSFVRIYGGFAEEVREMLKAILLDGARVWYTVPA